MSTGVVQMVCPRCQTELSPGVTELVFSCTGCRTVWRIGREELEPQRVIWATPETARPWWRVPVKVTFRARHTFSGSEGPDPRWRDLDAIWVPAWTKSGNETRDLAIRRTFAAEEPEIADGMGLLEGCILDQEDAVRLLELIVVTVEARRGDQLKSVDVEITSGTPLLFGLP